MHGPKKKKVLILFVPSDFRSPQQLAGVGCIETVIFSYLLLSTLLTFQMTIVTYYKQDIFNSPNVIALFTLPTNVNHTV